MRTILFIVADEATNAGERDSMKGIAAQLNNSGKNIAYYFYKIPSTEKDAFKGTDARSIPLTNAIYENIPRISGETHDVIKSATQLDIVGVGNSSFRSIKALHAFAESHSINVQTHYITHMVNDKDDLKTIHDNDFQVFSPATRDDMAAIDANIGKSVRLVEMDTVPHTNVYLGTEDYDSFMRSANGPAVQKLINNKMPFVFIVINGGSGVGETDIHIPYTAREAQHHGTALGKYMPAGTALIATHGGPRNLVDEEEFNQPTLKTFAEAYKEAQQEKGIDPVIVTEPFKHGLSYNAIKAGFVLGKCDNCVAFISNAEGFGTMVGAVLHIDNHKKLLGMFLFDAVSEEKTGQRMAHIDKYNRLGIAILEPTVDGLTVRKHRQEMHTPLQIPDPSCQIVEKIEILSTNT